jgi:hypothetical protein
MKLRMASLSIEHFRSLGQLRIEGLGRVNLITGRNNTGKSSVLEALRILASDASPTVLWDILRYREENLGDSDEASRAHATEGPSEISSLFPGFPSLDRIGESIVIASNGSNAPSHLSLSVGWFSEERDTEGFRRLIPQQPQLFSETELIPALVIEVGAGGTRKVVPLDSFRRLSRRIPGNPAEEPRIPCVFVSPYGSERTAAFGWLWDKIALSDREQEVVEALRIITPDITAVSMVGGEGPRQRRVAIVKTKGQPRPLPLRSFGDGLNRLFGIVLSLVNAKNGLLLIDEVENGMHHTIQADLWRAIFRLSRRLDTQVFATSHSWDSIEAFQKAAAEEPEDGVLIRLSRKGHEVIPTMFREKELAIATRDGIEVR